MPRNPTYRPRILVAGVTRKKLLWLVGELGAGSMSAVASMAIHELYERLGGPKIPPKEERDG